jgi:hypothetical protein
LPHGTPYAIKVAASEKSDKIMAVQFRVTDLATVRAAAPSSGMR